MDFQQLECFVRAYNRGSFTAAANELYLAPTSFAYRIVSLEKELGVLLFARSKRGVEPTDAARAIYEDAQALLKSHRILVTHARTTRDRSASTVHVGFNRYPNVSAFFSAIEAWRSSQPQVGVEVDFAYLDDPVHAVTTGTHDVVFLFDYARIDYAPLRFLALGELPYSAVMANTHPLAGKETLAIADFAGQTFLSLKQIASTIFQVPSIEELRRAGAVIDFSSSDDSLLILAVKSGRGISAYPAETTAPSEGLVRRRIVDCPPLRYGLLFSPKRMDEDVRAFVDAVAAYMRSPGIEDAVPGDAKYNQV